MTDYSDRLAGELAELAAQLPAGDLAHAERLARIAAIVCEAFRRRGILATLVGGGAVEFHTPRAYSTGDMDFVVERWPRPVGRSEVEAVLGGLGLVRDGMNWIMHDVYVQIVGTVLEASVEEYDFAGHRLRVITKEEALAGRLIGFKHWRVLDYGVQAVAMLRAFGSSLDEPALLERISGLDDAADAYRALRELAHGQMEINAAVLANVLDRLQ